MAGRSVMEEMEGILAERKKKRPAASLKEHVQRSRSAIGGDPGGLSRRVEGGLRGEMRDQSAAARSKAYERSPSTETAPHAGATTRVETHPHAPPAKELRHAEKAIRVHRNVIKAGERGIRVTPKAMAIRMAGKLAKKAAKRLPFIGGLITAGSVAKGIFDNPTDADRVIAREAFGINLPERKKRRNNGT